MFVKKFFLQSLIYFSISALLLGQSENEELYNWSDLNYPGGVANCMFYDNQADEIFVGNLGDIYKLDLNTLQWSLVDSDPDSCILANANILSICKDKTGCMYAGCTNSTPSYYSTDNGMKWKKITDFSFSINSVYCIVEGPDSSVWFGTTRGLVVTYDHGRTYQEIPSMTKAINVIVFDSNKNIFVGTNGGLFKSTDNGNSWQQINLLYKGSVVFSLGINKKGHIYAGTNTYLYYSLDDCKSWNYISPDGGTTGYSTVRNLVFDKDDNLIVLTSGFRISYDSAQSFITIPVKTATQTWLNPLGLVIDNNDRLYTLNQTTFSPFVIMGINTSTQVNEIKNVLPGDFLLEQNYPNPFNPATVIGFKLPVAGHVTLKVFDLLGREIATLVNENKVHGTYQVKFDGSNLSSGIYFYKLQTESFAQTKKFILMK